jgi:hypothetical protein
MDLVVQVHTQVGERESCSLVVIKDLTFLTVVQNLSTNSETPTIPSGASLFGVTMITVGS